jgi:hypothetical protein
MIRLFAVLLLGLAVAAGAAEPRRVKRPARHTVAPGTPAPAPAPAPEPSTTSASGGAKAAAHAGEAPRKELPKMEWKGQYGGAPEAGHRLITDQKGWEALWRVLGKDAPALDFKAYNAVAVFIGEKPTGGWTAVFDEPREKDGDTLVSYRIKEPKGFTTQAFTQPYLVRAFPKPAAGKMLVMQAASE